MNQKGSLFGKVRSWSKQRQEEQTQPQESNIKPGEDPRDMTGRFHKNRQIDEELIFEEAAERSKNKHKRTGLLPDEILGEMLLEHWATFFRSFREDEKAFELQHFQKEAASIQRSLNRLEADELPDIVTLRQMLFLLTRFMKEHLEGRDERIDDLLIHNQELEQNAKVLGLTNTWYQDEQARCRELVIDQLSRRETIIPQSQTNDEPILLSNLLCTLFEISSSPSKPPVYEGKRKQLQEQEAQLATETAEQEAALIREKRQDTDPDEAEDNDEAHIRRGLRAMLNGEITAEKIGRLIGDQELGAQLHKLAEENRRYKNILERIGLSEAE